ncbi:bleomycin resistance protein [Sphingobacterium lactis]|uniref:Bleomycin resistance protein n=1 Tax=Sphingobacterium lactis TaxID=797291 RepID=A0A1H5WX29_9SPHI|nr:VOC family protein [Sphingobacterium lactis]SEG04041.1 hypothetical protein SAMN05421877_104197 [Sphingobacterium lactis]
MLTSICPKLPMRDKLATKSFYIIELGFSEAGREDFESYLILKKDHVELHFFSFQELDPLENYGQVYIRTDRIDELYQDFLTRDVKIHPNGNLAVKPWGQKEFSILDPDSNLITFGEAQ